MATFKTEAEIRRTGAAARRNRERWQRNSEVVGKLWDGPATKPSRPSAGEALYSSSKAKLLPHDRRGGVSPLGHGTGGRNWWNSTMSRTAVMKGRK
jgi:hypothetical protein